MDDLPHVRLASAPLAVIAATLAAGILISHYLAIQSAAFIAFTLAAGLVLTLTSAWLISNKKLAWATVLTVTAFLFAGFTVASIYGQSMAASRIARLYDEGIIRPTDPVELTGVLHGQPESASLSFYLKLRSEKIRFKGSERDASGTVLFLAHVRDQQVQHEYDSLELRHGARVRVITALDREENFRNPGVLPFTEYLERNGYDATGMIKSPLLIERLDDQKVFLPLAWLYEWRECLQREFNAMFSAETSGVLDAALLGNHYNISRNAAERFRAGGTFHVLVISGLQIAFIGGLVLVVVHWFTERRLLRFLLAATFLWAYTIAVGADASVARSALMFTAVALAPAVSRRANTLNSLGGAGLALLVWRPNDLFDPSFQLTFLSVLAIVALAVPIMQRMQRVGSWRPTMDTPYSPDCARWFRMFSEALFWSEGEWRREIASSNISYRLFKNPIAGRLQRWRFQKPLRFAVAAIVVSASVQIGMLPLLIIYFHRLSIASLVLNIFVGILMAALGLVALATVLVSQFSPSVAAPLILLTEKTNWLMIHLVDPFTRLGLASIRLPHYTGWPASLYWFYFLPLGFLVFALARWNPLRPLTITKSKSRVFSRRNRQIAMGLFLVCVSLIVVHPFSVAQPDGRLHVDFLDVGQGDSALLTMPDGTNLLIDGGGRPRIGIADGNDSNADEPFERDTRSIGEGVVSEYLWSRGLDHVDYILASHADADHIDGLNDVARNFKVRGAIVARSPSDDPEYLRFANTMRDANVPVEKVGAGDVLRFGNVKADVLWPPPTADDNASYANNDGMVLRIRYGDKLFLFLADIERHSEAALLNLNSDLHSDIVKVAHHGSKTSSTQPFVAAANPSIAIISVGRTSIFGHPNKEVVERWHASGARVMTTGEKGTISVVTDGRTLNVTTFSQ